MIWIHRLDGSEFMLNIDLIENVETKPDTIITLTNGKKIVTRESAEEIRRLVIEFKRQILSDRDSKEKEMESRTDRS